MDVIVEEDSLERLVAEAARLDAAIGARLSEILAPIDREDPDDGGPPLRLPPLDAVSVRAFLTFCDRAGPALDERFSPGRDDEGLLGLQFSHPLLGLLAIDFRGDGSAWVAWAGDEGRRGSGRCPAGDLLTPRDPVHAARWPG